MAEGYVFGVLGGIILISIFIIITATKASEKQKLIKQAEEKFEAMAEGKTYDEIVAILKKPQEEYDKVCPQTGTNIKVAKWKGGYYYWEKCMYDITVVIDENGIFNNVHMYEPSN